MRVGPQNVSNGWQGPFGGVGATDYVAVTHRQEFIKPITGWAVTGGSADVLRLHNPGAGAITVNVLIMGTIA